MHNRTPMKRGNGFKKLERLRIPPSPPKRIERGTVASCAGMGVGVPKTVEQRNPHLLSMARGQPCMLRIPGVCNNDWRTTVACHSNFSIHGKAGARKADDQYHCAGCSACHRWLDQTINGPLYEVKLAAFLAGHALQVLAWQRIAGDMSYSPKDRRAVHWALCLLGSNQPPAQAVPEQYAMKVIAP